MTVKLSRCHKDALAELSRSYFRGREISTMTLADFSADAWRDIASFGEFRRSIREDSRTFQISVIEFGSKRFRGLGESDDTSCTTAMQYDFC